MRIDVIDRKNGSLVGTIDIEEAANRIADFHGAGNPHPYKVALLSGQALSTIAFVYRQAK